MKKETLVTLAALFGFLGVALGAFGTHGLAAYFEANPTRHNSYQTATQYLMYHALALLGAAWITTQHPGRWARWAGILFTVGVVLFCGSLLVLSLFNVRFMGAVAPFGGAAFLAGWVSLALAVRQKA